MRYALCYVIEATDFPLTYAVPMVAQGDLKHPEALEQGDLVLVPVRNRTCVGVFWEWVEQPPPYACKPLLGVLPYVPRFTPQQCQLALWMHRYYLQPLARCLRALAPGFIWAAAKSVARTQRFSRQNVLSPGQTTLQAHELGWRLRGELCDAPDQGLRPEENAIASPHPHSVTRGPAVARSPQDFVPTPIVLNPEQEQAATQIRNNGPVTHVLFGVTGSGKTEVYLKIAQEICELQGKQVLTLVPEIALTPQMSQRFRRVFGPRLGVLHSGLTAVEYEREWFRIAHGQVSVVLGVRSAVFAPLNQLGLMIVDEEHDSSYKSEESPCYQARDVAVKRAQLEKCTCILGSATPSVESIYNVRAGRYLMQTLGQRAQGQTPVVSLVDAKDALDDWRTRFRNLPTRQSSLVEFKGKRLSRPVIDLIAQTARNGEQSMVIVNRRGYTNYGICADCGTALCCPHCSVTTTLHKKGSVEVCHYCGFSRPRPQSCFQCGSPKLLQMGAGTQSIEDDLKEQLPELRVERLDRDVISSPSRLAEVLGRFRAGEVDCMVGTQILAKGHDFPKVTAVAILHIEDSLYIPDYRSGERTFQLIIQAAGRAGRGAGKQGQVLLQSLVTGHPLVEMAMNAQLIPFYNRELALRELGGHPPFQRHILVEFSSGQKQKAEGDALIFKQKLLQHWQTTQLNPQEVTLNGPFPAPLERLRNQFRVQISIISHKNLFPSRLFPFDLLEEANSKHQQNRVKINVDPYSFL